MLHFTVDGMSCGHCVKTIKAAVERVAPGAEVNIDLEKRAVVIASDRPLDSKTISDAIIDEGYKVASFA